VEFKWAVGGDAGELVLGVAVKPDHLEILTDRAASEEISVKLRQYQRN
jgi:hypothetical protein